jgi:aryl-alcohol dehydrogenase-like predicted oxidoreductase
MRYRPLGRTGIAVSELGFGSHLKKANIDDRAERRRQIQAGIDAGITLFDIYEHSYQQFEPMSEALSEVRDQVVLSLVTVWRQADEVMDEVEYALRVFKRETIDLYRLVFGGNWEDSEQRLQALARAKEQGKIRAIGAVVHYPEHLRQGLERYPGIVEYVMVPASFCAPLLLREDRDLAPLVRRCHVGIIAMKPMAAADHVGGYIFKLSPPSAALAEPWAEGLRLGTLAVKYVLQSDVVASVLPAMNSVAEVRENALASGAGPLTAAEERFLQLYRDEAERVFPDLLGADNYWVGPWRG